jgi:hypothetical protein
MSPTSPKHAAPEGRVQTAFRGDTLRSGLLNAFGWWKVSQITSIASLIAYGLGTIALPAGRAMVSTSCGPGSAARKPRSSAPFASRHPARLTMKLHQQMHMQVGHRARYQGQKRHASRGCPPDPAICPGVRCSPPTGKSADSAGT